MSSIIVLDSSDEETDSTNKKPRIGRNPRPAPAPAPVQSMARVNPVNAPKKQAASLPNDNFKIHLPSKRSGPNNVELVPPEKRIRRIKPTTVVRSNDEEWMKRQNSINSTTVLPRNGVNQPTSMLTKNLVNSVKGPIRVVKSPVTVDRSRNNQSPARVVVSPAPGSTLNYVRVAWNGKDPKPAASPPVTNKSSPVINKNITASVKEQPKLLPPVINKNITASVKEQNKVVSLSPPIFNKNSVTIRRVLVNDERPKAGTTTKIATSKIEPSKATNSTSIRRVPMASDPLKITVPPAITNKSLNNSALRITQVNAPTSATSIRKITSNTDPLKLSQPLPVMKKNTVSTTVVTTAPSVLSVSPAALKRIVTVDLPKTPASPPVITNSYSAAVPKRPTTTTTTADQPKSSMSMSVITKNHASSVKTMPPPVLPKPSPPAPIMTRPGGLIVTAVTCTTVTTPTPTSSATVPPPPKPSRSVPNTNRSAAKQSKIGRSRAGAAAVTAEQSLASMFNMFPPGAASFMGAPPMMFDSSAFMNPAYMPNRSPNFPAITPPVFNLNYPSFSGGSITPILSPGTSASPTYNTGRSSKSPVTSTVTRTSNAARRSPAGFMGMPIDVDQPMPPMSPPVFNMNHPPFNGGDPFNFMRTTSHTIPSPAYSPVRSTKSPSISKESAQPTTSPSSPVYRDLDNFVRNPLSYPRTPSNTATSSTFSGNGPIFSVDSTARNHHSPTGFFKSPTSTITSPAHSTISEGSSVSEVIHQPKEKTSQNEKQQNEEAKKDGQAVDGEEEEDGEEEVIEPLNPEYETLLQACRDADSSEDMNRLIESKLIRYYYSVHPDFAKSRGFRKAVVAATESIKKNPDLVYLHLRPVVEEMKARKKSKAIVMTNDEKSEAAEAAAAANEGIEDKVRNRQIRRLNKALYILTRKIHKLENDEVDLDDENSSYLIVERYKKRACEIYDKICDLTGESRHALRQVKKPITFKETDYPKFNKVVETFVNKTKEFPDFFDVLRMLEFCNDRYKFGLLKEEMAMIAQDAFIKIGKLLQSRRKADLYETVSHFTSDYEDPAANDPALLAKLSENEKNQTSIGSIIDKYAREQVRRKAESAAESANASGDELNNTSESCDSDAQSHDDEEQSNNNNNNNSDKKADKESEKTPAKATTNGTHSPHSPHIISSASPSPAAASTSATFRTSPPHAFASPQASPRPRSLSPSLPPPPAPPSSQAQPLWTTTNSLKILSVTSLNDSAASFVKKTKIDKPPVGAIDEIVISDEDL